MLLRGTSAFMAFIQGTQYWRGMGALMVFFFSTAMLKMSSSLLLPALYTGPLGVSWISTSSLDPPLKMWCPSTLKQLGDTICLPTGQWDSTCAAGDITRWT